DWTHSLSKAPMLKAQHPDYELYMTGVHAERGVSCADCHMPYKVEGGMKFTDHHIQSPLNNIATACQTCHRESENQLREDVYSRQKKLMEIRRETEKTIADAHILAKMAWDNGATEEDMEDILILIRHAQWRWDWVAASNGFGFHSPVESMRVLGTSIQKAEKAKGELNLVLSKLGLELPVEMPDISTKEKAQKYVGIDIEFHEKDKQKLLDTVVPKWDEAAEKRQGTLHDYTKIYK
ncbi:MAG: ammonia-forming cytochrome c nitrite reductase subunit c552, partial [bacterium]